MADHRLAGRDEDFLELRLPANGILESNKLALGQGNQERLEDDNGLSQAGIQVVVVRVHLSPHFLGIQRGFFGEVVGGKAKLDSSCRTSLWKTCAFSSGNCAPIDSDTLTAGWGTVAVCHGALRCEEDGECSKNAAKV